MIDIDFGKYKSHLLLKRRPEPPVLAPETSGQSPQVLREKEDTPLIFDPVRRKYMVRTPEEVVRQLVICYLMEELGYSANSIQVEKSLTVNGLHKRFDILGLDGHTRPFLLIECKAPSGKLAQKVFQQIAWYNMPLQVPYLMVTNGIETYCCRMDYSARTFSFIETVPLFSPGISE
jgi:Type I restriction enzyme R protein N terminus (HSDR_N)